ncbi:MAG: radical SAM protein [Thermoanaerobaculia bacterium]
MSETLRITEIFLSLQGESSYAGLPCVFVRLTGCSLRCVWCDSAYAFTGGTDRSIDEVVDEVISLAAPLVEITGGEPLEQEGFYPLSERLLALGKTVLVETGGHVSRSRVDPRVIKIVDLKCPGSAMEAANDLANLDSLNAHDEVKFVVADRRDFDYALALVDRHDLIARCTVLISPVFEGDRSPLAGAVAEWIRDSGRRLKLNLQLHKLLWGDVAGR